METENQETTTTAVKQHTWVKHIIVPVQIVPSFEEGVEFVAWAEPEVVTKAEDAAAYGCMDCDTPLAYETVSTGCSGSTS